MTDPMEVMIREALSAAGIRYAVDGEPKNRTGLDFYLLDFGVYIEVKQFHTDRIAEQMSRVENVIVAQGRKAVEELARWIGSAAQSNGR